MDSVRYCSPANFFYLVDLCGSIWRTVICVASTQVRKACTQVRNSCAPAHEYTPLYTHSFMLIHLPICSFCTLIFSFSHPLTHSPIHQSMLQYGMHTRAHTPTHAHTRTHVKHICKSQHISPLRYGELTFGPSLLQSHDSLLVSLLVFMCQRSRILAEFMPLSKSHNVLFSSFGFLGGIMFYLHVWVPCVRLFKVLNWVMLNTTKAF